MGPLYAVLALWLEVALEVLDYRLAGLLLLSAVGEWKPEVVEAEAAELNCYSLDYHWVDLLLVGLLFLVYWKLHFLLLGVRCQLDDLDLLLLNHCPRLLNRLVDLLLRTWVVYVGVSTALDIRLHGLLDYYCSSTMEVVEAVAIFWMGLD